MIQLHVFEDNSAFYIPVTCSRPLDSKGMLENRGRDVPNAVLLPNLLELISFLKFGAKKVCF